VAQVLIDAGEYRVAEKRLREAVRGYESMFGKNHPRILICMKTLALAYGIQKQWDRAEELLVQVIKTRKMRKKSNKAQGVVYLDTLRNLTDLLSILRVHPFLRERHLRIAIGILKIKDDDPKIAEEEIVRFADSFNRGIMSLLLDRGGDSVHITEKILVAAVGNYFYGKEVVKCLLERGDDIQITEKVLIAAAENESEGKEIITLLLDRGSCIRIHRVLVTHLLTIVEWLDHGKKPLIDQGEFLYWIMGAEEMADLRITLSKGKEVLKLLCEQSRDNVDFTNEAVEALKENSEALGPKFVKELLEELSRS